MSNKRVLLGMSGGVDSSVAAILLKEQGYEVVGLTMKLLNSGFSDKDAKKVCERLNIEHHTVDYTEEFNNKVIKDFCNCYANCKTPNPCIECNKYLKFGLMQEKAKELNCDYIATGHYAKIKKHGETGRYCVEMSAAASKDQTYVLYNLTQEQLEHTLMPCGEYTKEEIRDIAEKIGLKVANKPDSMEICFIPDNDYVGFIERVYGFKAKKGNFVDMQGNVLGRHQGIINYTVGQRKGLGIAFGKPVYVNRILPERNEVVLGSNEELFHTTVFAEDLNFAAWENIDGEKRAKAKIRYAHKASPCTVSITENGMLKCVFDEPQRAATPGQALVVYDDENHVLCGGTIYGTKA